MKHILSVLILMFGLSLAAHADWTGVWYTTKAPNPSDREAGTLNVILSSDGSVQADLIYLTSGSSYHTDSGTWTLLRAAVYKLTFTLNSFVFTGTIKKNFMSGKLKRQMPVPYGGKFQCTLANDE